MQIIERVSNNHSTAAESVDYMQGIYYVAIIVLVPTAQIIWRVSNKHSTGTDTTAYMEGI